MWPFKKKRVFHIINGLNEWEAQSLAEYNSEVSRGLIHTYEYKKKMQKLHDIYNSHKKQNG